MPKYKLMCYNVFYNTFVCQIKDIEARLCQISSNVSYTIVKE